ncbi:MAG TPA: hypothetical protein VMU02_01915, partial [bacterium]|nr:hypothetical protein [bacterium]
MSTKRTAIALILLGILLRLALLIWAKGTLVDDAYISLRYAANLVHGKGLIYNQGLHVLSTTSPLYTLWVALLIFVAPRIDPGYVMGITNLVFFGLAAWWLWTLCSAESRRSALLVLIFFCTFIRFVDNTIIGMETTLFMFGMMLSLVLLERRRLGWVSLILALSALVRPEGVFWAGAVSLVALLQGARPKPKQLLPAAIVAAAWLAFSIPYYGSPIPYTVKAKSGWFVLWESRGVLARIGHTFSSLALMDLPDQLRSAGSLLPVQIIVGCATLVAFCYGVKYLLGRRSVLIAFPLVFLFYLAFYLLGRAWIDFSWYGIPSGLAYLVTVAFGLEQLGKRLVGRACRESWLKTAGVAL